MLANQHAIDTTDHSGQNKRRWHVYKCSNCGGLVTAWSTASNHPVAEYFPQSQVVHDDLPEKAKSYLQQAIDSLNAPAGAVMLSASAVDAMLKEKGFTNGSLYSRIGAAVEKGAITADMATWAHEIRLDANDQRHADEHATLPNQQEAERCIEFAKALGQFMFVLPARINRGIASASE
jgi:hypothetical protein